MEADAGAFVIAVGQTGFCKTPRQPKHGLQICRRHTQQFEIPPTRYHHRRLRHHTVLQLYLARFELVVQHFSRIFYILLHTKIPFRRQGGRGGDTLPTAT